MVNNRQENQGKTQINAHRRYDLKRHQYPIRLSNEQYLRLKKMAGNRPMSEVVNRGINTEWEFYLKVQSLIERMPNFKSLDEIQKWRLKSFKNNPELLSKYVLPMVIEEHTKSLIENNQLNRELNNYLETINYAINQIGRNINQLARKANSGNSVPRDELRGYTKSVIELKNSINETFKGKI